MLQEANLLGVLETSVRESAARREREGITQQRHSQCKAETARVRDKLTSQVLLGKTTIGSIGQQEATFSTWAENAVSLSQVGISALREVEASNTERIVHVNARLTSILERMGMQLEVFHQLEFLPTLTQNLEQARDSYMEQQRALESVLAQLADVAKASAEHDLMKLNLEQRIADSEQEARQLESDLARMRLKQTELSTRRNVLETSVDELDGQLAKIQQELNHVQAEDQTVGAEWQERRTSLGLDLLMSEIRGTIDTIAKAAENALSTLEETRSQRLKQSNAATAEHAKLSNSMEKEDAAIAKSSQHIQEVKNRLAEQEARLQALQHRLESRRKQMAHLEQLNALTASAQGKKDDIDNVRGNMIKAAKAARASIKTLRTKQSQARKEVTNVEKAFSKAHAALTKDVASAEADVVATHEELQALERELAAALSERTSLEVTSKNTAERRSLAEAEHAKAMEMLEKQLSRLRTDNENANTKINEATVTLRRVGNEKADLEAAQTRGRKIWTQEEMNAAIESTTNQFNESKNALNRKLILVESMLSKGIGIAHMGKVELEALLGQYETLMA